MPSRPQLRPTIVDLMGIQGGKVIWVGALGRMGSWVIHPINGENMIKMIKIMMVKMIKMFKMVNKKHHLQTLIETHNSITIPVRSLSTTSPIFRHHHQLTNHNIHLGLGFNSLHFPINNPDNNHHPHNHNNHHHNCNHNPQKVNQPLPSQHSNEVQQQHHKRHQKQPCKQTSNPKSAPNWNNSPSPQISAVTHSKPAVSNSPVCTFEDHCGIWVMQTLISK